MRKKSTALEKQQLFEIFEDEKKEIASIKRRVNLLCKKHSLEDAEVFYLIRNKPEHDTVPAEIFSQKLSPLEAVVSFLKNNQDMNFCSIAKALNRDQRTVWVTYANSMKKQQRLSIPIKSRAAIPLNILSNRNLSILELVTLYLKDKKVMTLTGIAELLGKNTSTICTALNRARKKHARIKKARIKKPGQRKK